MKMIRLLSTLAALATLFVAPSLTASVVVSEDFSDPLKFTNAGADRIYGGSGGNYTFGTWVYNAGNMGIDNAPEGLEDGSSNGNSISSIDMARVQDERGANARAISVIFDGSLFTPGEIYEISFDVISDPAGNDASRYWLAAIGGVNDSDSAVRIDGTHAGWATAKPFTVSSGSASVDYLLDGVLLPEAVLDAGGEPVTTRVSGTFTYASGTDIGFSVGTYNNVFGFDNVEIAVIPEPSTYAMLGAGLLLVGVMIRQRRK